MEENHTLCSKCRGWLGILGLFLLCLFSSCTKVLCPGYAPTFIIDDSLRSSMFSLFDTDGEPLPARRVKKDKHHLLVPISPSKRYKEMRLVRSKFIYPTAEDSTEVEDPEITASDVSDESEIEAEEEEEDFEEAEEEEDDLEEAEEEEDDLEEVEEEEEEDLEEAEEDFEEAEEEEEEEESTGSIYRYGYSPQDHFNVDQVFYNEQFGHLLVAEEAELAEEQAKTIEEETFDLIPTEYVQDADEEEAVTDESPQPTSE